MVEAERQWIFEKTRHAQKYEDLSRPPGKELVNGALALYLGRNYRIEMVEVDSDKIEFPQTLFVPAVVTTAKSS